jgi:hypothetical protein
MLVSGLFAGRAASGFGYNLQNGFVKSLTKSHELAEI